MSRRSLLSAAAGLVLLVGGVVVALRPRAYGWTAYTPLSDAVFSPGVVLLDPVGIAALTVAALGLAVLAGAVGYHLGVRRRPPSDRPGTPS